MLNLEQFKRLVPLEEYFVTITKGQYKRASTSKEDNIVVEILGALGLPTSRLTCAKCVYNMYQRLAKLYFEFKEILNSDTLSDCCTTTSPKPETNGRKKKKR